MALGENRLPYHLTEIEKSWNWERYFGAFGYLAEWQKRFETERKGRMIVEGEERTVSLYEQNDTGHLWERGIIGEAIEALVEARRLDRGGLTLEVADQAIFMSSLIAHLDLKMIEVGRSWGEGQMRLRSEEWRDYGPPRASILQKPEVVELLSELEAYKANNHEAGMVMKWGDLVERQMEIIREASRGLYHSARKDESAMRVCLINVIVSLGFLIQGLGYGLDEMLVHIRDKMEHNEAKYDLGYFSTGESLDEAMRRAKANYNLAKEYNEPPK